MLLHTFLASSFVNKNAVRRSRFAGCMLLLLTKALGATLLMTGVCIKLAIQDIVDDEDETSFGEAQSEDGPQRPSVASLLAYSVGISLLFLYGMRICHYGGVLPRATDPFPIKRLTYIWWATFAAFSALPFLFVSVESTLLALAIQSGLLLALTVVETYFTHVLEKYLPTDEAEHGESMPLRSETPKTYSSDT
mmetsp:Transcript_39083/g.117496  ORF Transcript_39083/g.117496 Transcript_39083/m.117496 type:complete len:193 (+) Transcript_39083:1059-1637(+)